MSPPGNRPSFLGEVARISPGLVTSPASAEDDHSRRLFMNTAKLCSLQCGSHWKRALTRPAKGKALGTGWRESASPPCTYVSNYTADPIYPAT
jgi:hypothetical protein